MNCPQQTGVFQCFECPETLVMLAEGTAGVCMPEGRGQAGATAEHIIKQLSPPIHDGALFVPVRAEGPLRNPLDPARIASISGVVMP